MLNFRAHFVNLFRMKIIGHFRILMLFKLTYNGRATKLMPSILKICSRALIFIINCWSAVTQNNINFGHCYIQSTVKISEEQFIAGNWTKDFYWWTLGPKETNKSVFLSLRDIWEPRTVWEDGKLHNFSVLDEQVLTYFWWWCVANPDHPDPDPGKYQILYPQKDPCNSNILKTGSADPDPKKMD